MKSFAIIPAAGTSSRMGQPKLTMPWRGRTIIEQTIAAWQSGGVSQILVIVRPGDAALEAVVSEAGVAAVIPPDPPPEMKDSVQYALRHVAEQFRPQAEDVWLLAPADMPQLSPRIVARLLKQHNPAEPSILIPTLAGRRGHPVLFPWPLASKIGGLGPNEGVNVLLARHAVREIACDDVPHAEEAFADIDTPEEYRYGGPHLSQRLPSQ